MEFLQIVSILLDVPVPLAIFLDIYLIFTFNKNVDMCPVFSWCLRHIFITNLVTYNAEIFIRQFAMLGLFLPFFKANEQLIGKGENSIAFGSSTPNVIAVLYIVFVPGIAHIITAKWITMVAGFYAEVQAFIIPTLPEIDLALYWVLSQLGDVVYGVNATIVIYICFPHDALEFPNNHLSLTELFYLAEDHGKLPIISRFTDRPGRSSFIYGRLPELEEEENGLLNAACRSPRIISAAFGLAQLL
ncbi:unnamed protein product, partial [Mesorhabditis spiculigera]